MYVRLLLHCRMLGNCTIEFSCSAGQLLTGQEVDRQGNLVSINERSSSLHLLRKSDTEDIILLGRIVGRARLTRKVTSIVEPSPVNFELRRVSTSRRGFSVGVQMPPFSIRIVSICLENAGFIGCNLL